MFARTRHLRALVQIEDGEPVRIFWNHEDARIIRLSRAAKHMVFQAYGVEQGGAGEERRFFAQQRAQQLARGSQPVTLRRWIFDGGGARVNSSEKNWLPWRLSNGRMAVLQKTCPDQVVLGCSPTDGSCKLLYRHARLAACPPRLRDGNSSHGTMLHGSAPPIHVGWLGPGVMLGAIHVRKKPLQLPFAYPEYDHAFFLMNATPPFQILSFSPWFRFPPLFGNALDRVQFASSLEDRGDAVTISYGVADCSAMQTTVAYSSLFDERDTTTPGPRISRDAHRVRGSAHT